MKPTAVNVMGIDSAELTKVCRACTNANNKSKYHNHNVHTILSLLHVCICMYAYILHCNKAVTAKWQQNQTILSWCYWKSMEWNAYICTAVIRTSKMRVSWSHNISHNICTQTHRQLLRSYSLTTYDKKRNDYSYVTCTMEQFDDMG